MPIPLTASCKGGALQGCERGILRVPSQPEGLTGIQEQKQRFFKKGGALEDWNELLQGGRWPDG